MSDRLAFEKWFGAPAHGLDRLGDGYRLSSAHSAWGAWQAGVAAERERHRLEVHSCGPTCTMAGCVNARLLAEVESWAQQASDRTQDAIDLVAAERERCAKHIDVPWSRPGSDFAAAIRAKA